MVFQRRKASSRHSSIQAGLALLLGDEADGALVETLRRLDALDVGLEAVLVLVDVDPLDLIDRLLNRWHILSFSQLALRCFPLGPPQATARFGSPLSQALGPYFSRKAATSAANKGALQIRSTNAVSLLLSHPHPVARVAFGLECLRLKAKPASNRFRRDDNRTVGDRDRPCSLHGHCVSFLPEKGCTADVLPGSKLMQICSISSVASGSLRRPH